METIRTARLELVPLTEPFVDAVRRGDMPAVEREIGAIVSPWLIAEPAHLVQLQLARTAAGADAMGTLGRVIVVVTRAGHRRLIGSIGFHGPPDERGRLEVGYAIEPAAERRGYVSEAVSALVAWAAERYGISRFVVSVPSPSRRSGTYLLDGGRSMGACHRGRVGSAATRTLPSSATTGTRRRRTSPPGAPISCDRPPRN